VLCVPLTDAVSGFRAGPIPLLSLLLVLYFIPLLTSCQTLPFFFLTTELRPIGLGFMPVCMPLLANKWQSPDGEHEAEDQTPRLTLRKPHFRGYKFGSFGGCGYCFIQPLSFTLLDTMPEDLCFQNSGHSDDDICLLCSSILLVECDRQLLILLPRCMADGLASFD